jgi:hypothetical protein
MAKKETVPTLNPSDKDVKMAPTMHMHEEHLAMLGQKKLPSVGDTMKMHVHGKVVSVADHGDGNKSVGLELTKMKPGSRKEGRVPGKESDAADGAKAAMDTALAEGQERG